MSFTNLFLIETPCLQPHLSPEQLADINRQLSSEFVVLQNDKKRLFTD
jgi:hypothetical protein